MQVSSVSSWVYPLLIGAACLGALYLFLRWFERANVWIPKRVLEGNPANAGLHYEEHFLTAPDRVRIHSWYIPHENPRGSLLFCHGNAGNISHRVDSIRQFHSLRLNVLIFDYRGYGLSQGWLSEQGTYTDAETAYHWLKQRKPNLPIILFGRSMGSAVATELATRTPAAALIFESGFTSIADMGRVLFPMLPVQWFHRIQYDSLSKIHRINMPLLVVHGKKDDLVPYRMGQQIFDQAQEPKALAHLPGGHNEGHFMDEAKYLDDLNRFLEQWVFQDKTYSHEG